MFTERLPVAAAAAAAFADRRFSGAHPDVTRNGTDTKPAAETAVCGAPGADNPVIFQQLFCILELSRPGELDQPLFKTLLHLFPCSLPIRTN